MNWPKFRKSIDLHFGIDKKNVVHTITENNVIKGPDTWLLICSIMIASLGLDLNSPAVIIGAMLISPLMLPILGTGLAVGTNDWNTLSKSSRNFGFSVLISIVTSFIYFSLTPFGNPTEEILARTHPTFLDVMIAFFGGIAGIVSATRKDITNSIPGVAIATALMPPLCVVGFGLANNHLMMALNSFYLFFLNSFFVALATYLIVRYLRFPYKSYVNSGERKKATIGVLAFMAVLIIPSFFILNNVLSEVRAHEKVKDFIEVKLPSEKSRYIDSWQIYQLDSVQKLVIMLYGNPWDSSTIATYQDILKNDYELDEIKIEVIPTTEIGLSHFNKLKLKITEVEDLYTAQIKEFKSQTNGKNHEIKNLQEKVDSLKSIEYKCSRIHEELNIVFPNITQWQMSKESNFNSDSLRQMPLFIIELDQKASKKQKENMQEYFLKRCELLEARFIFDLDT